MIPRAANITVSTQLPEPVRRRLIEASFVEWPDKPLGESQARRVAVDEAIKWGKVVYPGLFKAE